MLTSGKVKLQGLELTAYCWHNRYDYEICLAKDNVVVSSYKTDGDNEYMFIDTKARQVAAVIKKAFNKKVAAKKISTAPFKLGIMEEYPVSIAGGIECVIGRFGGNIVGFNAYGKDIEIDMVFASNTNLIPSSINYVKLTKVEAFNDTETGKKVIPVRSLAEIALDKDISWIKDKKYYIVQDEEVAERIFRFLENYDGPIAYDTETTGLRMNCFSKYGSTYMADLAAYNNDIDEQYRSKVISGEMSEEELEAKKVYSDKLTGIIFCWKPNESYYFPCGNRMFENLYENRNKTTVQNLINSLRAKKRLDDPHCELESTQYMNSTSDAELTCDFILMDRCRDILQNKHLVAHNGPFEWKVGYIYDIITNIKDDTMILHQIMYKFKDTSRNSGENSSLKYLVHKEFNVDQLELSDFFAGYSDEGPEIKGSKRKKKKGYKVDFSYMDFDGSRAYAPADGDFTLQLFIKYKKDLVENYRELEYIYNVEVLTSCAIAYMEFYGHRIDESKINGAKEETAAKCAELEKQIRELAGLAPNEELNIASPAQMTKLFFERLEIPFKNRDEKPSVSKKVLKQYLKLKDADGNPQYPIINAYSEWKKMDTLMTKFFDNLPNFMYPGGFIFSSYKQIETGTGRMSCIEENAKVQVVGGEKCIKDIQVGDLVYCYDDEGDLRIRKVLNVIDKGYKECIKLNWISTGNSNTGSLICTPDHKVLTKKFSWVPAISIDKKTIVYGHHMGGNDDANNIEYTVKSIESVGTKHVYDLEVEEFHNFIANEITVHNCNGPNAQQYPKVVTAMVSPRKNCVFFDADYSQIEYRVLTALAKEKNLMDMFRDPDTDYHTLMASRMYGVDYSLVTPQMRSDAKSFNFGIPYGMGFGSLAILLRGANTPEFREEAMEKYELYFKDQPNVRQFFDDVKEAATVNKYTRTQFNRRRYYRFTDKEGNYNNAIKARALRQAGNAVIQGCLDGNVRVQTKEFGIVKLKDVADSTLHVWDGDKWSRGDILYSGKKRKCVVKLSNGQSIVCSPIHKFLVGDDPYKSDDYKECEELKSGDIIKINHASELRIEQYSSSSKGIAVESVEITDEYIDMYDVCNTDGGYYVADGIITHNTAADVFKIAMARVYTYIRKNKLFGKVMITNMVHDEGLYEMDVTKVNPKAVMRDIVNCMQFNIDGYPPLFVGGGFGMSWKDAKGKNAEIHPILSMEIAKSVEGVPIRTVYEYSQAEVIAEFDKLNYEFRLKKIKDYLCDENNFRKALHPVIGNLLNTFFSFGIPEDEEDRTMKILAKFIEEYQLPISVEMYSITETEVEVEEDVEYEDEDEENEETEGGEIGYSEFALLDESDKAYGVNLVDLIDNFGYMVSMNMGVCGIDIRGMRSYELDKISVYLEENAASADDDPAECLEVVLLTTNNILNRTGYYVKGISGSNIAKIIKAKSKKMPVSQGTIEERLEG